MAIKEEIIRGFGKCTNASSFGKSEGHTITNDFLCRTATNFFKFSLKHRTSEDYLPFIYKERQVHSVLCPAINVSSDSFLIEAPVNRKKRGDNRATTEKKGWVDYYCNYRNISYFIEVKHSFYSITSGTLNDSTLKKWKTANRQLQSVKKEITDWIKPEDKGAFRMSMLILPYYTKKIDFNFKHTDIAKHHSIINTKLNSNWSSLCIINDKLSGPYEYVNATEKHPAVGIYCKISEIHK